MQHANEIAVLQTDVCLCWKTINRAVDAGSPFFLLKNDRKLWFHICQHTILHTLDSTSIAIINIEFLCASCWRILYSKYRFLVWFCEFNEIFCYKFQCPIKFGGNIINGRRMKNLREHFILRQNSTNILYFVYFPNFNLTLSIHYSEFKFSLEKCLFSFQISIFLVGWFLKHTLGIGSNRLSTF